MDNRSMRVALYARVSTADKGQETENQLAQLRQFCDRKGWTIVREYVDHLSARTAKRPQFQALFQDARVCLFDLVLFWSLDRFSREGVLETLQHLQRLNGWGVGWRSFTEEYLDSCGTFRDAVLSILATIAKQERVRLSERTVAGLERARRQGKKLGRPKVVCDRSKVRALRKAGRSLGSIATELRLTKTTVARIVAAG
jgi:DNA invertase Pin-like site-specific DNA recombinase